MLLVEKIQFTYKQISMVVGICLGFPKTFGADAEVVALKIVWFPEGLRCWSIRPKKKGGMIDQYFIDLGIKTRSLKQNGLRCCLTDLFV